MKKFLIGVFLFIFVFPFDGQADDVIKKGEQLNVEKCIGIALGKHPSIVAAQNTVKAYQSRVGQAKANYYPQINLNAGYSRISPATSGAGASTGAGTAFDQYTSSATLSQNIFDFGRTPSQVRAANFNYDSSKFDFKNVSEQLIQIVEQAYYGALQANRNRDVNVDIVKQFELHLEQAKGFFEVGTRPKFDVIKAEADLSNARLNLIRAENACRIAVVTLNNAMGVPDAPDYGLEDNLDFRKYEMSLNDALSKAYESRPDMQSAAAKRKSAEASLSYANAGYLPFLTGNASYNWSGEKVDHLDHGWTVGAAISVPVFSGFLTRHQVGEAEANLNVAKANEESLRQTVILDVQQAYLNLKEAEDSVPTAELGVQQAQENMDIANGRYAAGVGNPIEVADAEVLLANAKLSHIQALYNYKVAQANLEKAMGIR